MRQTNQKKIIMILVIFVFITFISIFSMLCHQYDYIDYNDIFSELSNKRTNNIITDNKLYYVEDTGLHYELKYKVSSNTEDNDINGINDDIIKIIKSPIEIDNFTELRKRMELHTALWDLVFGKYEHNENINNYKMNLTKNSSFLTKKNINSLPSEKKLLAALHQSLYPWLYNSHFKSFKKLIKSYKGKGLVISTGNKHFKLARSTIDTLRNVLHSEIPIEIIYNGEDDLSKDKRKILKKYKDVYTTDISKFYDNKIIDIDGWAIKPYAILASRFEEVILIDADVMYLRDPMELYEDSGYKETGTLFFRDRTLYPGPHPAEQWVKSWMIDPLPETKASRFWNEISQHEMESSTVVINKTKNIIGLLSVCKLNEGNIRSRVVYTYVYGDKETFWIGFDMARQHYHMNPIPNAYIGTYYKDEFGKRICGHLGHMLPNGELMFWNGHIIKDKSKVDGINSLIDFNSYYIDDNHGNWTEDLRCLIINNNEPIIFDDYIRTTLDTILEREKEHRFIISQPKNH